MEAGENQPASPIVRICLGTSDAIALVIVTSQIKKVKPQDFPQASSHLTHKGVVRGGYGLYKIDVSSNGFCEVSGRVSRLFFDVLVGMRERLGARPVGNRRSS